MGKKPENQKRHPQRSNEERRPPQSPFRGILAWAVILGIMLLMITMFAGDRDEYKEIPYSPDFVTLVKEGDIEQCEVIKSQMTDSVSVKGTVKKEVVKRADIPEKFKVNVVDSGHLAEFLDKHEVNYSVPEQNPYILHILTSVLPILLIFGILYFFFIRQVRSAGHGALSFGKSKARLLAREKNTFTFENVAGIDEAKEDVQEIIDFLKDPKKFQRLGGRIPKGVMLMGPPGTGKTLLAKAIAGEAEVPFFSISGSDFVEMFVGVGASRVRDMFEQGKKNAPCIIFVDEIDAVGRSRFTGIGGGHDEREQTLNALLVEMDGFETQEGVIILAATNRPDVLDPALMRPGRFDRQISIPLPMLEGRAQILAMHAKNIKLAESVNFKDLARGTPGFSGADLENLLNEAALQAGRQGKEFVDQQDMEEARDKVRWGREQRSRVLDEDEKKITAYHESGHALVTQLVEESEPLHKITIIPRGVAYLGATFQLPEKDRFMEGRNKLKGMLAGLMGGRVAETMMFGDITSGAASDLKEATKIARLMVCEWGMSEDLGPQAFGDNQEVMFLGREVQRSQTYSEDTARKIDAEVDKLLRGAYKEAKTILETNQDKLNILARALLEEETLEGRCVGEIVEFGHILSNDERKELGRDKHGREKEASAKDNPESGEQPQPDQGESGSPAEPEVVARPGEENSQSHEDSSQKLK